MKVFPSRQGVGLVRDSCMLKTTCPIAGKVRSGENSTANGGLFFQQDAQHPGGLFVNVEALGEQIQRRLVIGGIGNRQQFTGGTCRGFLRRNQLGDPLTGGIVVSAA